MKISKLTGLVIIVILFYSCDPGRSGKTILNNQTSFSLELRYNTWSTDTFMIIPPKSSMVIYHIGGLGEGRDYDCCPCAFKEISLTVKDSNKTISKFITETNNWLLINENTKRYSNKEINCSFLLEQKDIQ